MSNIIYGQIVTNRRRLVISVKNSRTLTTAPMVVGVLDRYLRHRGQRMVYMLIRYLPS